MRLFKFYLDKIIQRALEKTTSGVKAIRYADDTKLIAEPIEDLQSMVSQVVTNSKESKLTLNIKNTKFVIIIKSVQATGKRINGELVLVEN